MASKLNKKFQAVSAALESELLERATAIKCALLALLSGEHLLLLGPPGTAKSLLVRKLRERVEEAGYFERLLTQFSVPEELFGPVDLAAYADKGVYTRIDRQSLTTSHFAFLDEVFKANSAILNSLLTLINERIIHEVGMDPKKAPLLTLFAASNETPEDGALAALYDRFLLKLVVSYVSDEQSFEDLVLGKFGSGSDAKLTLDDIRQAQAEVVKVTFSADAVEGLKKLRSACRVDGLAVSDRKWVQCAKLLKASAWLDGRNEVDVEDLGVLSHSLWMDVKSIKAVERCVFSVSNPLHLRAVEIEDQAAEVFAAVPVEGSPNYKTALENALQQLTDQARALEEMISNSRARDKARARESLDKVAGLHKQLARKALQGLHKLGLGGIKL